MRPLRIVDAEHAHAASPLEPAALGGVLSGAAKAVDTVHGAPREVREQVAHERLGAAKYELCEGGSIGEIDRMVAANPKLGELRRELCSVKASAP
jgi:hypothetical protein